MLLQLSITWKHSSVIIVINAVLTAAEMSACSLSIENGILTQQHTLKVWPGHAFVAWEMHGTLS